MLALYTGLRHEDVRTLRFEYVDFDDHTLHLPNPKGGEAKAFTIPLSKTPYATLERRQRDNAKDLGRGDEGWGGFPGNRFEGEVGPVAELRQATTTRRNGKRVPVGRFRSRTCTRCAAPGSKAIANDEGITEPRPHVLSNHSFGSHNVNATYISQHIDHLAACAKKIDAGIRVGSGQAAREAQDEAAASARRRVVHATLPRPLSSMRATRRGRRGGSVPACGS